MALINGTNFYARKVSSVIEGYGIVWRVDLWSATEDGPTLEGAVDCLDEAVADAVISRWSKADSKEMTVLLAFVDAGKNIKNSEEY